LFLSGGVFMPFSLKVAEKNEKFIHMPLYIVTVSSQPITQLLQAFRQCNENCAKVCRELLFVCLLLQVESDEQPI